MNLSTLLASRDHLNEQARLANTAFAYVTLERCAQVARRAGITGLVRLQQPNEQEERYWATLSPMWANPSVVEEHFSEDDVAALADAVAYATGSTPLDVVFPIEDIVMEFGRPLEATLSSAGVRLGDTAGHRSSTGANAEAAD